MEEEEEVADGDGGGAIPMLPQQGADAASIAAATAALGAVGGSSDCGDTNATDAASSASAEPTERLSLLEACTQTIIAYSASSRRTPLRLPGNLLAAERAVLHDVAASVLR
jgi:hypothetical protein